ncbi:unnamed protein product, partial [marine sediment metagenome]
MGTHENPVKVSALVAQARDRLSLDDGSLLRDMSDGYQMIRS